VLKRDKKKKGEDNYQDSVTAPIDRTFDDDAIGQEEDEEGQDEEDSSQMLLGVLSAIEKVSIPLDIMYHSIYRCKNQLRKIIRAVRSSPQRRQAWLAEVTISLKRTEQALRNTALMLILDVKTRWSSTHQMLRKQANSSLLTSHPIHSLYLRVRSCTRLS
jgi:hypothetical protein